MDMNTLSAALAVLYSSSIVSALAQEKLSAIQYYTDEQVAVGSAAVRVKREFLIHSESHTGRDFAAALEQLEKTSRGGTLVKLHVCLEPGGESLDQIAAAVSERWPEKAPAVTIVEASGGAPVSLDAVWQSESSDLADLPLSDGILSPDRDIIHISGRAASGELDEATSGTMEQLFGVLRSLGADRGNVVQVKAFIQPIDQAEVVRKSITESFGELPTPPLVFVQWTSTSRATEIELIAEASEKEDTSETISYYTPPGDKVSPVYSRVARIHSDEVIYLGGLAGTTNTDPTQEVATLYDGLKRVAALAGTDLRHLAKATYYVADNETSAALNELRPGLYDPARPPAASKVQVPGVGLPDRGILIDMVAAPARPRP